MVCLINWEETVTLTCLLLYIFFNGFSLFLKVWVRYKHRERDRERVFPHLVLVAIMLKHVCYSELSCSNYDGTQETSMSIDRH